MIYRSVSHIACVPLDSRQDQEIVILPEVADPTVIRNGDKVIASLPVNADSLYGVQYTVGLCSMHVHIPFIPIAPVLKNPH